MRILVVEDEKALNSVVTKTLEKNNYVVDSVFDGAEAYEFILSAEYDTILLDIMLPEMDGLTLLKKIRNAGNSVPVILLTAKDSLEDRVKGLDHGADDYIVKPFLMDELLARVRACVRRSSDNIMDVLQVADLTVDCSARRVKRDNEEIELSSKEFAILEYLIRHKGIVMTRDQIEQHVWNYDYVGGSNIVDVYVRYLRKKIDDSFDNKLIQTVRGVGYVLRDDEDE